MTSILHKKEALEEYLRNIQVGVEYQPILTLNDFTISGYEALARFKIDGKEEPTESIFEYFSMDTEILNELERRVKEIQIQNRPPNKTLYLNFNPIIFKDECCVDEWVNYLSPLEDIVIEIIESNDTEIIEASKNFMGRLKEVNKPVALDDLFSVGSIFSPAIFMGAEIIKVDMNMLQSASEEESYLSFLKDVVAFSKNSNKRVVLEGVETKKHLDVALHCDSCLVQGHLFEAQYIRVSSSSMHPL